MIKLKKFKYLLLLMFFAFAEQNAWAGGGGNSYAGTWFTFRASLSSTGEGKVYGDFTSKANAINHAYENVPTRHRCDDTSGASETNDTYSPNDINLHLWAEASDGWEFVEWRDSDGNKLSTSTPCDASGNATSESTKYGYATVSKFKSKNVCARNLGSGQGASDTAHVSQHKIYSENVNTRVDAYYVAVFNKLEKDPVVTAEPLDETLGEATFDPADNQVGDVVTLATHPKGPKDKGYQNKFIGWQYNGNYLVDNEGKVVKDNPLSFEVTEDNVGVYYAVYESGYMFYRIKNYVTKDYFVATGDVVDGTGVTALPNALEQNFIMQNEATVDAGSVYEINTSKNTDGSGRIVYDLEVQNKHTQDYYTLPSIYIRLNQDADKNAWNFSTANDDGQGTRLRVNDEGVQSVSTILDDRSLWYIEPMDKDLETAENYFSLDPAKLVQVGNKYYTTLRTSWNILFNPEQMTPYVVTNVDETAGTFEMEALTGNIIPAGTPVIIETSSNVVLENRMVPTTTNAASGAVPTSNLLQCSEKYFPNQTVSTSSNYKKLMVNANGELAFGGSALSTVNGNEAYLCVVNEVVLPQPIQTVTLAELVASGVEGKTYEVTDLIGVYAVENNQFLICKDSDGYAAPDEMLEGYIDFMHTTSGLTEAPPTTYDQSNWIGLRLPEGQDFNELELNHRLTGVVGVLQNRVNPEMLLTQLPTEGDQVSTNYNLYAAASFYGQNHQTGKNGKEYFFVQPKPMELAKVEMIQWDETKFIAPVHDKDHPTWNPQELYGEFEFNDFYLQSDADELITGHGYRMPLAVVKYKTAKAPLRDETRQYVVYPLNLERTTHEENGVITSVTSPKVSQVVGVTYYNVTGLSSDRPFDGLNIVVTRYSDGSTSTVKRLF